MWTWNGSESYGLAELVLSGFVRVANHPKVFANPSALPDALAFTEQLRGRPNCVPVAPGLRHWGIFCALCAEARAKGNLVPDAYLVAMAIESGCGWITTDRDFSRFNGCAGGIHCSNVVRAGPRLREDRRIDFPIRCLTPADEPRQYTDIRNHCSYYRNI